PAPGMSAGLSSLSSSSPRKKDNYPAGAPAGVEAVSKAAAASAARMSGKGLPEGCAVVACAKAAATTTVLVFLTQPSQRHLVFLSFIYLAAGFASSRDGPVRRRPKARPASIITQMISVISKPSAAARSISPVKLYSSSRIDNGRDS